MVMSWKLANLSKSQQEQEESGACQKTVDGVYDGDETAQNGNGADSSDRSSSYGGYDAGYGAEEFDDDGEREKPAKEPSMSLTVRSKQLTTGTSPTAVERNLAKNSQI